MQKKYCFDKKIGIIMLFLFIGSLLFVLSSQSLLRQKPSYNSKASELNSPPKIYGGTEITDPKKWPFMVRIFYVDRPDFKSFGMGLCGGALISKKWILTAGHCVWSFFDRDGSLDDPTNSVASATRIYIGNDISKAGYQNTYEVSRIIRHEGYKEVTNSEYSKKNCSKDQNNGIDYCFRDGLINNDIALYELKNPITISDISKPIVLNTSLANEVEKTPTKTNQNSSDFTNQYGVLLGFGQIETDSFSNILKQGIVPLLSNTRVNKRDWYFSEEWGKGLVLSTEIGGGYPLGRVDACRGDSGGPLIVWDGKQWVQVGIVSWGEGDCARPRKPNINVRVSKYIDWITEKTGINLTENTKDLFMGFQPSEGEMAEFNCRINNSGPTPTPGAQYKCGFELRDDDALSNPLLNHKK